MSLALSLFHVSQFKTLLAKAEELLIHKALAEGTAFLSDSGALDGLVEQLTSWADHELTWDWLPDGLGQAAEQVDGDVLREIAELALHAAIHFVSSHGKLPAVAPS